ncbi:MAG: DUF1844 domain-containing protein [Armatimonadota bacterium]|nr:DUF1844 domain-containing protein [Armatimonadota bacterium]MDR7448171.1 DUF1844 domain-containing protein [Armatimonadota bacterium]MDR7458896.1 DUF1844 domain-containing protein [Armatimonadota bacterium]MDR7479182.1 DUF1844 domain-containing protein [Armatimonadota bacterium]MDR7487606.1 DUF1844 domain-containing protein [Armatimonadota bacterium]
MTDAETPRDTATPGDTPEPQDTQPPAGDSPRAPAPESPAAEPLRTPAASQAAEAPQESAARPAEVDATALVLTCISLLGQKAWAALGLVPDPASGKIERHLEDARLAIDAAAALVEVVRGRVGETDRRELETLLTNLRLNYVEQRSREAGQR